MADARAQAFVAGDPASGVCYFTSIQQAIDAVPAGATIYVEAGIYSESLTVDKEITVIASHMGCSAPAPAGSNVIVTDVAPLTVNTPSGSNVEFQQFTFRDSLGANVVSSGANLKLVRSTSLDAAYEGISGGGGVLTLLDSVVWSNAQAGVRWSGPHFVFIQDSEIFRNDQAGLHVDAGANVSLLGTTTVHDNSSNDAFLMGGCIKAFNSTLTIADAARVYDCAATNGASGGAMFLQNMDTTIRDNASIETSTAEGNGGLVAVNGGTLVVRDGAVLSGGRSNVSGGNLYVTNGAQVTLGSSLDNVEVSDGRAPLGGGVAVIDAGVGGAHVTVGGDIFMVGNRAQFDGGGVYIDDAQWTQNVASIIGDETLPTPSNPNWAERGGGMFVTGSSNVMFGDESSSVDWAIAPGLTNGPKVQGNVATVAGGGLYVDGTDVAVQTNVTFHGAVIRRNKAAGAQGVGTGGGIHAEGNNANVKVHSSFIWGNRAKVTGGGIHVGLNARVVVDTLFDPILESPPCPSFGAFNHYCSELRDNEAGNPADGTTGEGGAFFVAGTRFPGANGGQITVTETAMLDNKAQVDGVHGVVEHGGIAFLTNSLVGDAIIDAEWLADRAVVARGELNASHTTFGGEGSTVIYTPTSSGNFRRNVVWPDGGIGSGLVVAPGSSVFPVANWHTVNTGLLPSGPNLDPVFVATTRGYYRLAPASPAVDHTTGTQPFDLEFCARPFGLDWDDGAFERGCP